MTGFEVVAAHDGEDPAIFLWFDPETVVPNGAYIHTNSLTLEDARQLALELLDAVESAEGLGQ